MDFSSTLATLASIMMLTPSQAVALPSAVSVSACKLGMSEAEFIGHLQRNGALRSYVAQACRRCF
ncbi:MAG: hypothetical protein OEU93_08460 [Rubrivivax sp.]|nr:hypothetical protein [Rubrivivax sp.]